MKTLLKVLLVLAVVALICEPMFAQTVPIAVARARQLGHAVPVVPTAAPGHFRPFIWLKASLGAQPNLPSFCKPTGSLFCPNSLTAAYQVGQIVGANGGQGMTIAIVDAFHYANAEADLNAFSTAMGLPTCTSGSGCFTQVWTPGTPSNSGWELEEMLDLEWAHAMAPKAKLLMIETFSNSFDDMAAGVQYGYANANIVSNSYGAPEVFLDAPTEAFFDAIYVQSPVPLFFSSGDNGASYTGYPCTSPYVTCIGGTSLYVNASFQRTSESAWADAGGACSLFEAAPAWQSGYGTCGAYRATPDISAVADPNTGVAVLDTGNGGWFQVGGTSLSTPVLAGITADIMTARVSFGKPTFGFLNPVIYAGATRNYPYFYFDVTTGNNGNPATVGYDLATGLGVPKGPAMGNRFFGLVDSPPPPPQ